MWTMPSVQTHLRTCDGEGSGHEEEERSHSPNSFHNDFIDAATFHKLWCNSALSHRAFFFFLTWSVNQHTELPVRRWNSFTHFPTLLPFDIPQQSQIGLRRFPSCASFVCRNSWLKADTLDARSQYFRTPRNQDTVCGNTMVCLDPLQEELRLRACVFTFRKSD